MSSHRRAELRAGTALWLALLLAGLCLARGLGGAFIFDDSWNLRGLEEIGREPSLSAGFQYIVNGIASEVGRPLSLATFALQYASWATNPGDFIWVNLCVHLLNGALLAWALLALFRLREPQEALALPVFIAALWVLAPLNASAVLYIVQRMTLLAGTFMLAGLLLYLKGRQRALDGQPRAGLALMTAGVGVGLGIGVLAKENAALFPLMLLVVEATLLADLAKPPHWRAWRAVCLVLPLILLVAALAWRLPGVIEKAHRDFTVGERLLTESRVLFLYLGKLALPSLFSLRLLYDDLPVSRSLVDPWTTLPAVVAWLAALAVAWRLRRRAPVAAFAVLWFLACHALESTIIPLELAFEHRNYLAIIGPLLALAWYLRLWLEAPAAARVRPVLLAGAGLYLGFQALALWHTADLWGSPWDLSAYWAARQPDSKRALYQRADTMFLSGWPGHALSLYEHMAERWPGDPAVLIAEYEVACYYPDAPVPGAGRLRDSLRHFDGQVIATINMMDRLIRDLEQNHCKRFPAADLQAIVTEMLANPRFDVYRYNVLLLRARIAANTSDFRAALAALDESIQLRPLVPLLVQGVIWGMEIGDRAAVDRYFDMAEHDPRVPALDRWSHRDWIEQIRAWRDEQDRAAKNKGRPS